MSFEISKLFILATTAERDDAGSPMVLLFQISNGAIYHEGTRLPSETPGETRLEYLRFEPPVEIPTVTPSDIQISVDEPLPDRPWLPASIYVIGTYTDTETGLVVRRVLAAVPFWPETLWLGASSWSDDTRTVTEAVTLQEALDWTGTSAPEEPAAPRPGPPGRPRLDTEPQDG